MLNITIHFRQHLLYLYFKMLNLLRLLPVIIIIRKYILRLIPLILFQSIFSINNVFFIE